MRVAHAGGRGLQEGVGDERGVSGGGEESALKKRRSKKKPPTVKSEEKNFPKNQKKETEIII